MKIEQSRKIIEYKIGDIVRYTGYEGDLINYPDRKPTPNKYFKVKKVNMNWGVVDYGKNTIGISNIHKTNFIEKILYWLLWQ